MSFPNSNQNLFYILCQNFPTTENTERLFSIMMCWQATGANELLLLHGTLSSNWILSSCSYCFHHRFQQKSRLFNVQYFLFVFVHCTTNYTAHEQLFSLMVESDLFSHLFDPLLGVYITKEEGLRSIGHYSCEWFIQWTIVNRSIYIKKRSKALPVLQQLTSKKN